MGTLHSKPDRSAGDHVEASGRSALCGAGMADAWELRRRVTSVEATGVARALLVDATAKNQETPAAAAGLPEGRDGLTRRELEVLRQVAAGKSNGEIADALHISVPTTKRHLTNIFGKLGVPSRSALNTFAHAHGLGPSR